MSQPLQSLAQDGLNVVGWTDGWSNEARLGRLRFQVQSCLMGACGLLPGSGGQAPWEAALAGTAPPSTGGCLSHCLAIFREELSSLAPCLKLGGCPAWGQPPTCWDWLGCDAKKPGFSRINLPTPPGALKHTLWSLPGLWDGSSSTAPWEPRSPSSSLLEDLQGLLPLWNKVHCLILTSAFMVFMIFQTHLSLLPNEPLCSPLPTGARVPRPSILYVLCFTSTWGEGNGNVRAKPWVCCSLASVVLGKALS